ncbi:MAG TPA: alpha/beta fold hydrolase [Kofleriaceae bacterium]
MNQTAWLARPRPDPTARLRLVCFPPAGGNDAMFRTWPPSLPAEVEVCSILLPGRDARRREPTIPRVTPLVKAIADGLAGELTGPFALFGHSTGALVAFELARELRRRGQPGPVLLVAAGRPAPSCPVRDPMHALPSSQLTERLRRLGGTPEAVLREPDLMAMFLPIVRADLEVNEVEPYRSEPPLACPIVAYGGAMDERCRRDELVAWGEHTSGGFSYELFPGGHFFVRTGARELHASLGQALRRVVAP